MAEHTSGKASSETLERDPARDLEEIEKEEPAAAAEKEAHHGGKKKKAAKKTKGFPFGSLIFMFVLIVFIMGTVYFGLQYMSRYEQIKGEYDSAVQEAESERDAAKALYDEADPESAANTAERQQVTEEMIAAANAELDALRKQSEETDTAIRETEEKIEKLQDLEDYDYYRAIYDEYIEGRAYVEELLSRD